MVKRVELGGNRLRGVIRERQVSPRARCVRRAAGPAVGALVALLATAAGYPGAPQPGPASTNPTTSPSASPAASPWLLSRATPSVMPAPSPQPTVTTAAKMTPLRHMTPVDLAAVSPTSLPASVLAAIRHLHGVQAAQAVDAARVQVNGRFVAVLGVDPSRFRGFATKPTARDSKFWGSVAAGDLGISYEMGKQDKLPAGTSVTVAGRHLETMKVGALRTVGIGGIDAVVSDTVARSLGFPTQNAIVISAHPKANFAKLAGQVRKILPHSATVEQLAVQTGQAGAPAAQPTTGPSGPTQPSINGLVTLTQVRAMLSAALSRLGMPYVWGAAGPRSFDCSGLVQWSFRQAGIVMPRVAADQARTGPPVPIKYLQPGDLLFYHTDPTAPTYISHVAIYLGKGKMLQAPEPGEFVEIVPVDLGSDFAGAVDVSPSIAAHAAATSV
jgi:cell wall-associated NlpC family hydrolase